MKNKVWYYLGQGMASFGIQDTWIEEEKMQPKPDEVLARIDAVAICAFVFLLKNYRVTLTKNILNGGHDVY